MHRIACMTDQNQQQPSTSNTSTELQQELDPRVSRLVRFGRRHPTATVAGIAVAGLVGGVEMLAGVLLGAGVAAVIARPGAGRTRELSGQTRGLMSRFLGRTPQEMKDRARAVVLAARGKITPPEHEQRQPVPQPSTSGEAEHATPA